VGCAAGLGCVTSTDCQSGVCTNGICQAPSCDDAVQNGAETDVDCGGDCRSCFSTNLALRCVFSTAGGGSGDCNFVSNASAQTDADNVSIIGGQNVWLSLGASGVAYDGGSGLFRFSASLTNLLSQALGTIDGSTVDPDGIRLVLDAVAITSGSGTIAAANADGVGGPLTPGKAYFQFGGILRANQTSAGKIVELAVPASVNTFALEFLVVTKAEAKLVVNEVLTNPGGTLSDAYGEWFEVYNAGAFPVNMQGFRIGDSAASGDRPLHLINRPLVIAPEGYLVFGNSADTTLNGGVPVDYAYGSALSLANSLDAIRIVSPAGYVSDYSGCTVSNTNCIAADHVQIDRVRYTAASISAKDGVSRELTNPSLDNGDIDGTAWADAAPTTVYGPGGRGTPGTRNASFVP